MPFTIPIHMWHPSSIKMERVGQVITSPATISGAVQALRTDGGGLWKLTFTGLRQRTHDEVRAWRSWAGELAGGVTIVNVPTLDIRFAPRPLQGGRLANPGTFHAGSTLDPYFPEVVGYGAPTVVATIAPAILRATVVTLTVQQGSRAMGGQTFEVDHPTLGKRVYQTGRVVSRDGQSVTLGIWPGLREDITATTSVNFDYPCLACRLVPDSDISLDLSLGQSSVNASFLEAF